MPKPKLKTLIQFIAPLLEVIEPLTSLLDKIDKGSNFVPSWLKTSFKFSYQAVTKFFVPIKNSYDHTPVPEKVLLKKFPRIPKEPDIGTSTEIANLIKLHQKEIIKIKEQLNEICSEYSNTYVTRRISDILSTVTSSISFILYLVNLYSTDKSTDTYKNIDNAILWLDFAAMLLLSLDKYLQNRTSKSIEQIFMQALEKDNAHNKQQLHFNRSQIKTLQTQIKTYQNQEESRQAEKFSLFSIKENKIDQKESIKDLEIGLRYKK